MGQAWERNYAVVTVEDIMTSRSAEMHDFAISTIFPLISRVSKVANISLAEGAV